MRAPSPFGLVAFVLATALGGCAASPVHSELGAPTPRYGGHTMVLLPRTCLVQRSVPAFHFADRASPLTAEARPRTARLRETLDALGSDATELASDGRPIETCPSTPPDLDFDAGWLEQVRASDETLQLMRARGAHHVVVLEAHTIMACARRDDLELLEATRRTTQPLEHLPAWSANDVCLEDEINLTAYLFREDGVAVWAVSRAIGLHDDVGWAVDRVLERIPAAMPPRRSALDMALAATLQNARAHAIE